MGGGSMLSDVSARFVLLLLLGFHLAGLPRTAHGQNTTDSAAAAPPSPVAPTLTVIDALDELGTELFKRSLISYGWVPILYDPQWKGMVLAPSDEAIRTLNGQSFDQFQQHLFANGFAPNWAPSGGPALDYYTMYNRLNDGSEYTITILQNERGLKFMGTFADSTGLRAYGRGNWQECLPFNDNGIDVPLIVSSDPPVNRSRPMAWVCKVDGILSAPSSTAYQWLKSQPELSNFTYIIDHNKGFQEWHIDISADTNLVGATSMPNNMTIKQMLQADNTAVTWFVPTNAAFKAYFDKTGWNLTAYAKSDEAFLTIWNTCIYDLKSTDDTAPQGSSGISYKARFYRCRFGPKHLDSDNNGTFQYPCDLDTYRPQLKYDPNVLTVQLVDGLTDQAAGKSIVHAISAVIPYTRPNGSLVDYVAAALGVVALSADNSIPSIASSSPCIMHSTITMLSVSSVGAVLAVLALL